MNKISIYTLKVLRKIYTECFGTYMHNLQRETDPNKASDMIYNLLASNKPCMIARFGAFELSTVINYLGINSIKHSPWKYVKGEVPEWWWNKSLMHYMKTNAGFFPPTEENLSKFCELMLHDIPEIDILASWRQEEFYLKKYLDNIQLIDIHSLNPFWSNLPWSRYLKNKKVLVIHPFVKTIQSQYRKRALLFVNQNILPAFELKTLKAVQSLGGICEYKDWFEALCIMEDQCDNIDYDIALIGCGAYGFPLAAHIKEQGKKAIHMGGSLQLLFGIKGKRWDKTGLYNNYWVNPDKDDIIPSLLNVENGCYL
jgi:hypothetical protein